MPVDVGERGIVASATPPPTATRQLLFPTPTDQSIDQSTGVVPSNASYLSSAYAVVAPPPVGQAATDLHAAIVFAHNSFATHYTIYLLQGEYPLDTTIPIYRDLTIAGRGADISIIKQKPGTQNVTGGLLTVNNGANVRLLNLTIQDGSAQVTAPRAIYGGALRIWTGTLEVYDSKFFNNFATEEGGAIFNDNGTLIVRRSFFLGNSAGLSGGAIHSYNGMSAMCTRFASNGVSNANGLGGAITSWKPSSAIDGSFIGNTAVNPNGHRHIYNATAFTYDFNASSNYWSPSPPVFEQDYSYWVDTDPRLFNDPTVHYASGDYYNPASPCRMVQPVPLPSVCGSSGGVTLDGQGADDVQDCLALTQTPSFVTNTPRPTDTPPPTLSPATATAQAAQTLASVFPLPMDPSNLTTAQARLSDAEFANRTGITPPICSRDINPLGEANPGYNLIAPARARVMIIDDTYGGTASPAGDRSYNQNYNAELGIFVAIRIDVADLPQQLIQAVNMHYAGNTPPNDVELQPGGWLYIGYAHLQAVAPDVQAAFNLPTPLPGGNLVERGAVLGTSGSIDTTYSHLDITVFYIPPLSENKPEPIPRSVVLPTNPGESQEVMYRYYNSFYRIFLNKNIFGETRAIDPVVLWPQLADFPGGDYVTLVNQQCQ